MSSPAKKKRITFRARCPNPLFMLWLEELRENSVDRNLNSQFSVKTAINSIKKYPVLLESGAECAILKGFGNYLCQYLEDKLNDYKLNNHTIIRPNNSENPGCSLTELNLIHKQKKRKSNIKFDSLDIVNCSQSSKKYRPAYRSGPFAILITLLKASQESNYKGYMTKEELREKAQEYCEESFMRPKNGGYYTAWSSVSTLIKKDFVKSVRKGKSQYSLTELGLDLAFSVYTEHCDSITSGFRPTVEINPVNENILGQSNNNINVKKSREIQPLMLLENDSHLELNESSNFMSGASSQNDLFMNSDQSVGSHFEFCGNSYDIILLVDKQETSGAIKKNDPTVRQLEKYNMIKYELRHLKVGDFTWIAKSRDNDRELVLPYIVERKRMDDLASSIKDGRFHEQKYRLKNCGIPNIIYLIENHINDKRLGLPLSTLMQAITNTRVQDNFMTHITNQLSDSIKFLAMMTKDLSDNFACNRLKSCAKEDISENCFDGTSLKLMAFSEFNTAASKTKPSTVKELFVKQLLQLKGVSVEKALAISSCYDTPSKLMNAYDESSIECGEMLLANIKYGVENRNIGPSLSKTLYYMFSRNTLT